MRIDTQQFKSAIDKVNDLASCSRESKAVLLCINEEDVDICYSTGRNGIIEIVPCDVNDDEIGIKMMLPLEKIAGIVDKCTSSGNLISEPLDITLKNNTVIIKSVKRYGENFESEGELASSMEYTTVTIDLNDPRYAKIVRAEYRAMLYGFDSENEDRWDRIKIVEALGIAKNTVYISKNFGTAFTRGNSYFHNTDVSKYCIKNSFILDGTTAKACESVIKGLKDEKIGVSVDENKLVIMTNYDTFALWAMTDKGSRVDLDMANTYNSMKFDECRMYISKIALSNAISSMMAIDKQERQKMALLKDENGVVLEIREIANGAVKSKVRTYVGSLKDDGGIVDNFEVVVILSSIKYAVDKFQGAYIKMSVDKLEGEGEGNTKYTIKMEDIIDDSSASSVYTTVFNESDVSDE